MNKKGKNVLNKWWYAWIAIPAFLFIATYIWTNDVDRYVFEWIVILVASLMLQLFMFKGAEYSRKVIHILFVVFVIITTMFTSHFIHKYLTLDVDGPWIFNGDWFNNALIILIQSAILLVFKIIYWLLLLSHHNVVSKTFDEHRKLIKENDDLKLEVEKLREENTDLKLERSRMRYESTLSEPEEVQVAQDEEYKNLP